MIAVKIISYLGLGLKVLCLGKARSPVVMGRGDVWVQPGWDGRFSCQRKLTGFDGWKHPSRQSPRFVVFCMPVYAYKYIKLKEVINSYNVFTDCVCINTNMHGLYCI